MSCGDARNYQKFSDSSEGLLFGSAAILPRFLRAVRFRRVDDVAKKTTITIETESLLIMSGRGLPRAWCPLCAAESELIALDSVGVLSNLDHEEVEEWLRSSHLHRSRSSDGSEFICLNSLLFRGPAKKTG